MTKLSLMQRVRPARFGFHPFENRKVGDGI